MLLRSIIYCKQKKLRKMRFGGTAAAHERRDHWCVVIALVLPVVAALEHTP